MLISYLLLATVGLHVLVILYQTRLGADDDGKQYTADCGLPTANGCVQSAVRSRQ